MAWNDSGNGKDPWKRDGEELNDLDKIAKYWQRRLRGILGGGGGNAKPGGGGGFRFARRMAWFAGVNCKSANGRLIASPPLSR